MWSARTSLPYLMTACTCTFFWNLDHSPDQLISNLDGAYMIQGSTIAKQTTTRPPSFACCTTSMNRQNQHWRVVKCKGGSRYVEGYWGVPYLKIKRFKVSWCLVSFYWFQRCFNRNLQEICAVEIIFQQLSTDTDLSSNRFANERS